MSNMERIYKNEKRITFTSTSYDAIKNADALIVLTEWNEFRNVDFDKIKNFMNGNIIIDGRNIYGRDKIEKMGLIYEGIGR